MFYWFSGGCFGEGFQNNAFLAVFTAINRASMAVAIEQA